VGRGAPCGLPPDRGESASGRPLGAGGRGFLVAGLPARVITRPAVARFPDLPWRPADSAECGPLLRWPAPEGGWGCAAGLGGSFWALAAGVGWGFGSRLLCQVAGWCRGHRGPVLWRVVGSGAVRSMTRRRLGSAAKIFSDLP
jgi:hypothetical protein